MIKYNSNTVSKWYDGASNAKKMYYGNKLMFLEYLIPPSYKLVAHYSDTTVYKVECDGNTTLSSSEVSGHTTPMSGMTSAVVSGCVTEIGLNAFSGASSLTSLTLSDDIRRFNNQAFFGLHSLESFTFPSSLTYLGGSTFRFSSIKKFNNRIPSGVTALPSGCFADMYSLSAITIPAGIVSGSTNVFLRDSGLTEVHFERTTAPALGADAFKNCTALIKIYIPDCDCYDSYAAQSQFSGLTNLIYGEDGTKCKNTYDYKLYRKLKNGVTSTTSCSSSSALTSGDVRSNYTMQVLTSSTSGLSEVIVGDCITSVSTDAFYGMSELTSITFSDNVTTIAASSCAPVNTASLNKIHDVVFGNKLTTIGNRAFAYIGGNYATNRPKLRIPKSVTSIGDYAFTIGRINELTFVNGGRCDIGYRAFAECSSYGNTVVINTDSIRTIGSRAFCQFSGLTSVSLTNVSGFTTQYGTGHQFNDCNMLTDFTLIGIGGLKIPEYFVGGESLTAVTFGGISSISNGYGINGGDVAASVRQLTMLDTTPPTIGNTSISQFNPTVIYVPASAVDTYKTATNWKDYKDIIQAIP